MATEKKTNLIVNYIPNSITEEDLQKMFERLGEVESCKLIKNKQTGLSMGYAFVKYMNEESAKAAVTSYTGIEIQGKRLKVSFADPPTGVSKVINNGNVYVANFPPSLNEEELLELFTPYGEILSQKILKNQDGTSRGAGFIMFKSKDDSDKAIKDLTGKVLPDATRPLQVQYAKPSVPKDQGASLNSITTSSLSGLGVATRVPNVRYNPLSGRPQVQGAIINPSLNANVSPVAAALSGLNAHVAQNSVFTGVNAQVAQVAQNGITGLSVPQSSDGVVTTVYVYGLQPSHTELTLYELFSPFGAILNVKLVRDNTKDEKPCKGYGFINFPKLEDALQAIGSLNGVVFEEKVLQVSIKQDKKAPSQSTQPIIAANPISSQLAMLGYSTA